MSDQPERAKPEQWASAKTPLCAMVESGPVRTAYLGYLLMDWNYCQFKPSQQTDSGFIGAQPFVHRVTFALAR